jgi:hypothetical protein
VTVTPDEGISLVTSRTGNPGGVTRHRTRRQLPRLTIRLLAVGLLLLGAGGGAFAAERQDRRQERSGAAAPDVSHRAQLEALRRRAAADQRTDRGRRSPLAVEAERARAQADAGVRRRVGRADPVQASPEPAPAGGTGPGPAAPAGPVPAGCGEYGGNRAIGCTLLLEDGFSLDQMSCLDSLWTHESGWNHRAQNPSSGAYGIPQALPGDKMAAYGDDWRTNPATQIRWGLDYLDNRYGTPCSAWQFWQANNWY